MGINRTEFNHDIDKIEFYDFSGLSMADFCGSYWL